MTPLETLREEHASIREVLVVLAAVADRLERGGNVSTRLLDTALDFVAAFLERSHRVKEEQALFPLLARRGLAPDAEPLAELRGDHDACRGLLRTLRGTLAGREPAPREQVVADLREFTVLLEAHLGREEELLFPLAGRSLSADDQGELLAAFEAVDGREASRRGLAAMRDLSQALVRACADGESARAPVSEAVAADVMRSNVPRLSPTQSLAPAAELMAWLDVRELPVVETDGRLVGILTRRDLEPHHGHYEWTPVRVAMSPDPVTVEPHATAGAVARLLLARCYNAVPVVAGSTLLGMIARSDLLRTF
jgi:CBS domain-containing protein